MSPRITLWTVVGAFVSSLAVSVGVSAAPDPPGAIVSAASEAASFVPFRD